MASDLISIASSGTRAARVALDVTAQNIANASTEGYVRRNVGVAELSGASSRNTISDYSQYGVVITGINRNADATAQAEVRRTYSDANRADTLVTGLTDVDNAVENSGVYNAITSFNASLSNLTSNPTDSSLRSTVLSAAGTLSQTFNVASTSLDAVMTGQQKAVSDGVSNVNDLAASLAQINLRITADTDPANNSAGLFDQRDTILQKLAGYGNIATSFNSNGTVAVKMGGDSGVTLVTGNTSTTLSSTTAADGTVSFAVAGTAVTLSGGSLAGNQQTLVAAADAKTQLDSIANTFMSTVNSAQSSGADLTGATGAAMFSGTGAADMALALTSYKQIATAASGSAANSQDDSNLTALRNALSSANTSGTMNNFIYNLSSAVSGNTTTRDALDTIYANAKSTLADSAGVNLDTEAANLVKYQQAFQASGKVISVAQTLFDQLLNI